jgi:hypothetical protein
MATLNWTAFRVTVYSQFDLSTMWTRLFDTEDKAEAYAELVHSADEFRAATWVAVPMSAAY